MDFTLTEEHRAVQRMVRGFCEKEAAPGSPGNRTESIQFRSE
jgi:hypothetical protein